MKRLLATTVITLALIGVANARVDMSGVTDVTKAQIRAGLHVYDKNCSSGLSTSLKDLLQQIEFYETIDFTTYYKLLSEAETAEKAGQKDTLCANLVSVIEKLETFYKTAPIAAAYAPKDELSPEVKAEANRQARAVTNPKVVSAEEASEDENGIRIKNGKLSKSYIGITQNLAVSNNGSGKHAFVMIECGFYFKGEQVGTGNGIVANLYPSKTKHVAVMGLQIDRADDVSCSVNHVMP